MNYRKVSRRLDIMIWMLILCTVASVIFSINAGRTPVQPQNITELLKEQQRSLLEARAAIEKQAQQGQENAAFFASRDSILNNEIKINRDEIKKVRNSQSVRAIANYNSADITRAFAELERQHNAAK